MSRSGEIHGEGPSFAFGFRRRLLVAVTAVSVPRRLLALEGTIVVGFDEINWTTCSLVFLLLRVPGARRFCLFSFGCPRMLVGDISVPKREFWRAGLLAWGVGARMRKSRPCRDLIQRQTSTRFLVDQSTVRRSCFSLCRVATPVPKGALLYHREGCRVFCGVWGEGCCDRK